MLENEVVKTNNSVANMTEEFLMDVRKELIPTERAISLPFAEIGSLGTAMAAFAPAVEVLSKINDGKLYRITNAKKGFELAKAKGGGNWPSLRKGNEKILAKLEEADISDAASCIDPAMIMIAVALYDINKNLDEIKSTTKQILSFLQIEKESQIEADVITLDDIVSKYKDNWNNELWMSSNHQLVCDIKREARKNILSYQRETEELMKDKKILVLQGHTNSILNDLLNKYRYYRLSLYIFSLASMSEIMLEGRFTEESIEAAISEIRKYSNEYRELFGKSSEFLEERSGEALEAYAYKGVGIAANAMGKLVQKIPNMNGEKIGDSLQEKGKQIQKFAEDGNRKIVEAFAEAGDPKTRVLLNEMENLMQIYNGTTEICMDNKGFYLIA
ncbi:MAG: hypothetical protein IJM91_07675 [Lachnospiraceae bacterium]|nr:hypothetical protein [Lachnospiraceae bacterium]